MFCECDVNCFMLSRGDTFRFPITINCGTKLDPEVYELKQKDTLYIAILEPGQSFENAIIRQTLTSENADEETGAITFILKSSDTEYMLTGKYFITIKLEQEDGTVTTVLPMKEFWLTGTSKDPCCCS